MACRTRRPRTHTSTTCRPRAFHGFRGHGPCAARCVHHRRAKTSACPTERGPSTTKSTRSTGSESVFSRYHASCQRHLSEGGCRAVASSERNQRRQQRPRQQRRNGRSQTSKAKELAAAKVVMERYPATCRSNAKLHCAAPSRNGRRKTAFHGPGRPARLCNDQWDTAAIRTTRH